MTPTLIRTAVISDRASWIRRMVDRVRELPLDSFDVFASDPRNVGAAESYLRRALEALFDVGRHTLAKGFGEPAGEYKAIADGLLLHDVLSSEEARILREMAGFRNRMVHLYAEIGDRELFEICREHLGDVEALLSALLDWLREHPELVDDRL